MKKKKKNNKKKKGFTLVELLAVIIILAIVIGITIPAVLTTTNNTKKKAFETAAQSVADWVDRQYSVYTTGLYTTGLATLDENWSSVCLKENLVYNSSGSTLKVPTCARPKSTTAQYLGQQYTISVTPEFVSAAGLKTSNVKTVTSASAVWSNSSAAVGGAWLAPRYTRIWIDPLTGKSCVTLVGAGNGDYGSGNANKMPITCGGTCQSTNSNGPDYCKKGTVTKSGSTYSFEAE